MSKNHSKTTRRLAEQHKKQLQQKRIMTPEDLDKFVQYTSYCCLYLNDCALNSCLELEPYLAKMTYKTKAPQTLYKALLRRVHTYFEMLEKCVEDKIEVFADIFGEMDEYSRDKIDNFKKAVEECLKNKNIEHYEFYAKVEEMVDLCDLAVLKLDEVIKKISPISEEIKGLHFWSIEEIRRVALNLMEYVYTACPCKDEIDLNKEERVMIEFKRLDKALFSRDNFEKAYQIAVDEIENSSNIEELLK